MTFDNFKFPALAVIAVAVITPLIDRQITGGFSNVTDIIELVCGVLIVGFVVVGFVNTVKDK